jgi:TonB family protein
VTLIAFAHVALLLVLWRHANGSRVANPPEITWLSSDEPADQQMLEPATDATEAAEAPATPSPPARDLELQQSTPAPKSKPASSPRKRHRALPTPPTPPKRKVETAKTKKSKNPALLVSAKSATTKRERASAGEAKGDAANGANAAWYGDMLHDRFYRAWAQPQSVVATGAKFSALARIRIERDGRVSGFQLVQPSGNVLVDQSVREIGDKVKQVDALPPGIGSAGHYDVNINFELNPR